MYLHGQVQVRHLGGALERDGRPAVAGGRPEPYLVSAMSMVMAPEHVEPVFGALDGFMASLEPWSSGSAPLTFLDRGEPLTRAYTGADLDRLRALKATADPDGVIRGNVPIPPA